MAFGNLNGTENFSSVDACRCDFEVGPTEPWLGGLRLELSDEHGGRTKQRASDKFP